jgi:hypothetical protein
MNYRRSSKKEKAVPKRETARDESLVIPLDGGLGNPELVARRLERIVFENCGVDFVPPPLRI